MLEVAQAKTRADLRAGTRRPAWGIVDALLAMLMLPFGIGMGLIDLMVWAIARVQTALDAATLRRIRRV